MLNNGKVKNESTCAQQKCWFAEKNQLNENRDRNPMDIKSKSGEGTCLEGWNKTLQKELG